MSASNERLVEEAEALAAKTAVTIIEHSEPLGNAYADAFAAFMMGAQWALEVAALDPPLAQRLISAIHEGPVADNEDEWNRNAMTFIAKVHDIPSQHDSENPPNS